MFALEKKFLTLKNESILCKNYTFLYNQLRDDIAKIKDDNNIYRKLKKKIRFHNEIKILNAIIELEKELILKFDRFEKFNETVQNHTNRQSFELKFSTFKQKVKSIPLDIKNFKNFKNYIETQFDSIFTALWESLGSYLEVQDKYKTLLKELEKPSNHLYRFEKERFELLINVKYENLNTSNQTKILEAFEKIEIRYTNSLKEHQDYISQTIKEIKMLKDKVREILKIKDYLDLDKYNEIQSIRHQISLFESDLTDLDYNTIDLIILDNRLNQIISDIEILNFSQKILEINKKTTQSYLSFLYNISENKKAMSKLKSSVDKISVIKNFKDIDKYDEMLLGVKSKILNHLNSNRKNHL